MSPDGGFDRGRDALASECVGRDALLLPSDTLFQEIGLNPTELSRRASAWVLGVSVLCVPLAAQSQTSITLYGLADGYVARVSDSVPTKANDIRIGSGGLTTSYIGVSAVEDLGGGYQGLATMQSFLRVDTGQAGRHDADPFWARDTYAGLGTPWGRITIGRNTTPFFLATIIHNPLGDSFVVGPSVTHVFRGNLEGDTGMSNSVRYQSPKLGGFKADVLYSVGTETTDPADKDSGQAIDAALSYGVGEFNAVLAVRRIDLNKGYNGQEQEAWMLGGNYKFSFATLYGQYMRSKMTWNTQPDAERRTWQLGASVPLGSGRVVGSYAKTTLDDASPVSPDRRQTWALGYIHSLSKRTELYAIYYDDKFDEPVANRQKVVATGFRHRF